MIDKDSNSIGACATCLALFGFAMVLFLIGVGTYFTYQKLSQNIIFGIAVGLSTLFFFMFCVKVAVGISKYIHKE